MEFIAALIGLLIQGLVIAIFVKILLSWFPNIDRNSPPMKLLDAIVDPILRPFRRIVPRVGNMDFSPLLAILVLTEIGRFISTLAATGYASVPLALLDVFSALVLNIIFFLGAVFLLRGVLALFKASPWNPFVQIVHSVSGPLMKPFNWLNKFSTRTFDTPAWVALGVMVGFYYGFKILVAFAAQHIY